ncbi:transcription elongation factor, mitochondrial isoform X2 [Hetaerina americana]|uniref:transcription elongation factor, mitochondrial isoform X2 n=1 Tax=Hetaerina americana TaxID=62018 RepID=UPI003A7F17C8
MRFIEPFHSSAKITEIQSVVGIHLGTNSLYWAKIARDGDVKDWKYVNLFPSADIGRKMSLPKIFAMMDCALENIPFSDIFVLEASNHSMLTSVSSPAVISSAILRSQMSAILLTILNLRLENEHSEEYYHKVFLLKQRIVSRFFNLLVGTERVSALGLVDLILANSDSLPSLSISEIMDGSKAARESTPSTDISTNNSLPIYTPIQVPASIIESYRALGAVEREAMSQALLITMAFYDLVVFKDPKILAIFQK